MQIINLIDKKDVIIAKYKHIIKNCNVFFKSYCKSWGCGV